MRSSRLSPSSLSASSSSSASSFSALSLPSSRQSSSASSPSLLSSPLSSSASRIPDGAIVSPGSEALGTRSVASSWSVAMLPGASGRSGPQSSHNSGHRGRPKLGSVATSRSDLRDVGLDKSRVYTRELSSSSSSQAFNNNPLGLSLNVGGRNNAAHLQDDSSYTAYPVTLTRPRYTSGATVIGAKNRRVVSNSLSSRQPSGFSALSFKPSFAVNSASSALSSGYQRSQTHSANSNAGAYVGGLENSFGSRRSLPSPNQQQNHRKQQQQQPLRHQRNHHQQLLQPRSEQQQQEQQQQQQRRNALHANHQHQRHLQHRSQSARPRSHQQHHHQGRHRQLMNHQTPTTSAVQGTRGTNPRSGFTRHVVDGIEVKATPARRLSPGGPLRIGLDINVRHVVYPLKPFKQS
ncbi:hypothetical protein ElyMa_001762000 [Elysia marginata]|uniref:Uncharacterized protein n=1 Tax=Elysia marginata TaxID=1093978 RepID=A0AAV4EBI5_9GAST|nr:hypothetical protein ElyMa_001762000 [Elysia marginata]